MVFFFIFFFALSNFICLRTYYLSLISLAWLDDSSDNNESVENCQRIIDNKIYKDGDQKLKIESLCLYLNHDFEKAQIIYEKLVEDDPDDRLSWYTLGEIYYHRDKQDGEEDKYYNKADSAFKKSLDLDPDFRVARIHIMDILYMAGEFDKLIEEETIERVNRTDYHIKFKGNNKHEDTVGEAKRTFEFKVHGKNKDEKLGEVKVFASIFRKNL